MDCEFRRGFWRGFWGGFWINFEKIVIENKAHQKIRFRRWIFFAKIRKSAAAVDFENPEIRNPPRRWILRIRKSDAEKRRIFRN